MKNKTLSAIKMVAQSPVVRNAAIYVASIGTFAVLGRAAVKHNNLTGNIANFWGGCYVGVGILIGETINENLNEMLRPYDEAVRINFIEEMKS